MNEQAQQFFNDITDQEWARLIKELTFYTSKISQRLRWRTKNVENLPGGETTTSIVSKALAMVLSGKRNWDPQKDPDLKKYLQSVIKSLLNHLVTSKENTMFSVIPEIAADSELEWEPDLTKCTQDNQWLARQPRSPEEELIEKEIEKQENQALDLLKKACTEDKILSQVLQAMIDGCENPAEIAQTTGLSIKEVYNATKRLDRKVAIVSEQTKIMTS